MYLKDRLSFSPKNRVALALLFFFLFLSFLLFFLVVLFVQPLALVWEEGIEWKGMKRLILEYFFLPLFGSFNGGNGKSIPLFESLSGREWNG